MSLEGKTAAVSGSGNVAIYAIQKAQQLGAKPVTCSDSTGWIYDPEGIDVELSLENLNDLNLFVDKMGNLSASILVKSNVKDYNDIVILN